MKYSVKIKSILAFLFLLTACNSANSTGPSKIPNGDSGDDQAKLLGAPNLGEETYSYLWPNMRRLIVHCISNKEDCQITSLEEELLKKIARADAQELAGNGLIFESGRENPNRFDLDDQGKPRSAVTGDHIAGPIYINTDYFENLSWNNAIALLVHELAHHHGVKDHAALDRLGLKVALHADAQSNKVQFPDETKNKFAIYTFSWGTLLTLYPYYAAPQIVLSDGHNLYDISAAFAKSIPCPVAHPYPIRFDLAEAYWEDRADRNVVRLRGTFDCSSDPEDDHSRRRMFTYVDSELRIEFEHFSDPQLGPRIIPNSVTAQYHRNHWTMLDYYMGDNSPLVVNRMMQEYSPLPGGGFRQIFRTRIETDPEADRNKDVVHCYGYIGWSKPASALGIPELEIPADKCTFTKIEDHTYDIEIEVSTSSFDPRNIPYFSRIGVHYESIHPPQEGSPLFRLNFRGTPPSMSEIQISKTWISNTAHGPEVTSPVHSPIASERFLNFSISSSEEIVAVYLTRKEFHNNGGLTRVRTEQALASHDMINPNMTVTPSRSYPAKIEVSGNNVAIKLKLLERGMGFQGIQRIQYQEMIVITRSMQVIRQTIENHELRLP